MSRTGMSNSPLLKLENNTAILAVRVWPELGQLLGLGRNTCYNLVASGKIKSIRVGSRIIVPLSAVEAYLGGEYDS